MDLHSLYPLIFLSIVGFIGVNIKSFIGFIERHLISHFVKSIKIDDCSEFYYIIQRYILREHSNRINNYSYRSVFDNWLDDADSHKTMLFFYMGFIRVKFNNNYILIRKENTELKNSENVFKTEKSDIVLYSLHRNDLLDFVNYVNITYGKADLKTYFNHKGGVALLSTVTKKNFNNIFLNDNLLDEIKQDLDSFIANKDKYDLLGLKYKHVYLFHGSAGTGKSSLISAIANYTNRPVLSINKSKNMTDNDLINLIANRPLKSVISFEDVDCLFDNTNRSVDALDDENDNSSDSLTLSCLLNVLDGAYTPNDVIFVLTTNCIDKLDSALMRDGRTNLKLEITKPNADTKKRYIKYLKGINPNLNISIDDYKNKTLSSIEKTFLNS